MSGAEIQTTGLKMIYRAGANPVCAVDGIDLLVPAGQFLLVRGRSGSGKTTLLHLLGALQRPTAGHVRIGDVGVDTLSTRRADLFRRRNIGLVFQFFNLVPSLTVEMNVALPLLLEGQRLHHVRDRVEPLLETLGIADRRDGGSAA